MDKIGINRNLGTEKIEECKLNSNSLPTPLLISSEGRVEKGF